MFDKINPINILKDHFNTLIDFKTKKILKTDILLFFVLPFAIAVILILTKNTLSNIANILITAFSIFAALLLNLLLLIYSILGKEKGSSIKNDIKIKLLEEIYKNISFCILISIYCLLFLFATFIISNKFILPILELIVYFLLGVFILSLFMILKRVHKIFGDEFNHDSCH
ncbi:MAG: hypothetical protein GYA51_00125 [Candidatus Methanofastidiosa archaeon]|jgi:hypothetical protein|nr:hypothetical protein [Candidatus Methanofastidiosa archaeon]